MGEEKRRRRKRHSADFKARVALEALKEQRTVNEIAALYVEDSPWREVHPVQVGQWKKQAREGLAELFSNGRVRVEKDEEALRDRLYQEIGQLKVELDWLKKKFRLFGE
jgi:putative transposase